MASDKPWGSISEKDYATPAAYCNACLINQNTGSSSGWFKSLCKLPVKEPGGAVNRGGVHAAAAALAGARGGVKASPEEKAAAARKLIAMYRAMQEEPPESLTALAK